MEAWARWRRASEYEDLLAEERVLGDKRRAGPDGVDADRAHQRCPSADGPQHVLDGPATFVDASTDGRLDGPGQPVQHAGLLSHRVLGSRGRGTRFSQQRLTALRRKPLLCGWTGQVASTGVSVDLSRDDGATWTRLSDGVDNVGFYDWTGTGPVTPRARIRVSSLTRPELAEISPSFPIAAR